MFSRYPLLWKELRESQISLWLGGVSIVCAIVFRMNITGSNVVAGTFGTISFITATLCILSLALARLGMERQQGTWEFLCTQPVSVRWLVAIKLFSALALGLLISTALNTISWLAFNSGGIIPPVELPQWLFFHASSIFLLISLFVLIDTIDWDRWLGIRIGLTTALLLVFMNLLGMEKQSPWKMSIVFGVTAVCCGAAAIAISPFAARDSVFPRLRWHRRTRQRNLTATHAWLWLQWRIARWPVIVLISFIPLMIVINESVALLSEKMEEPLQAWLELFRTIGFLAPLLLWTAATIFGLALPILDAGSKADSFRWSLPYASATAYRLQVLHSLALLVFVSLPSVLVGLLSIYWLHDQSAGAMLLNLSIQFLAAATLFLVLHVINSVMFAIGCFGQAAYYAFSSPFLSAALTTLWIVTYHSSGTTAITVPLLFTLLLLALTLSWFAAPHIGKWREI